MVRGNPKETEKKKTSIVRAARGRKISPFNRFMKEELKRLKDESPDMDHRERFKLAAANWKKAKEGVKTP